MIGSLIQRITELLIRRPWTVLGTAIAIVVLSGLVSTRLKLDPDFLKLVPQNNKEVNEFRDLITETGTLDFHVVVFEFPKGSDPGQYGSLIDSIGEKLRASKQIDTVTWRMPEPAELIEKVLPKALLLLPPQAVDEVAAKLTDEAIRESVARNRSLLQSPQSSLVEQLIKLDPFNLLPVYMDKMKSAGGGLNIDFSSGYYVSQDQSAAVIIARPHKAAQDLSFSRSVMEETRRFAAEAEQEFKAANPEVKPAIIGFTGGYAIAGADEKIIRRDMSVNSITSFLGVLLIYLYAYRRPTSLIYAAVPMMMAIVVTFGIAAMYYGTLSASSTGFAALLAGLGVDFMTVVYERYIDERNRGASVQDAVRTFMRHTLPGVIVGALTTAVTFYAFLSTDFKGMSQLGFLTASGIMVFMFCVIFVFPALIIVVERGRKSHKVQRVHAFGAERIVNAAIARPRVVILTWLIVVIIAGAVGTGVRFSDSMESMRSKGNEGVRLQEVVTQKFGQSFEYMMYGVRGATAEEAIAKTAAAMPDLDRIVEQKVIGSVQSISTFLPTVAQQTKVIDRLRQGETGEFAFPRIEATFRAALEESGFNPEAYDSYLPLFQQALTVREPVTMSTLESLGLSESVGRFLKKTDKGYLSIVYVYPTTGTWPRFLPDELQEFRKKHPEGALTGVNLVSQTLRTIILKDAIDASAIGFIVVFALLWLGFRSFARACLVFVPFIAGCTCMLGVMATFGIDFNFMNIFVGLMLVGTATDYAVYMLQRYDEGPDNFHHSAAEVARGVAVAAMMSIVGFASFAISHYPGVRSLGIAAVSGILLSCLASITLLPALLATGRFRHHNAAMLGERRAIEEK